MSDLRSKEIVEMPIFFVLFMPSTITAIFKFQFYISLSWLTFYALFLDAILPTKLVILYFQSINDVYQTVKDNWEYKTCRKIQKKQSSMPSLAYNTFMEKEDNPT